MVTMPANKHQQAGTSLIELLISSIIGVIALGIIGSIFIKAQDVAKNRSLELLLIQSATSNMQIIKDDLQRAGYDGIDGQSVKLSGAANIIETLSGSVGFAYHKTLSGADKSYQNIVYRFSPVDKKLVICEEKTLFNSLKQLSTVSDCNSLFDEQNINVTFFNVTSTPLVTGLASSSLIHVSLQTELVNIPTMQKNLSFTIKQRNWQ